MRLTLIFVSLIILSCTQKTASEDLIQLNGLTISQKLINEVEQKIGKRFEPLKRKTWVRDSATESGFQEIDSLITGIQISRVDEEKARKIVVEYLPEMVETGHYIFLKNLDFDTNFQYTYYDIAVIKCKDQFDLIKHANTSGLNYDITNSQVVEKLRQWNAESPFIIVVADEDRIEANFIELPKDLKGFGSDVYRFCPDVIDQGIGSEEELIEYFKSEKKFWLWWD